ncbi:uncharacterized protein ISCGN_028521 [Ixodes scapularis]
MYLTNYLVHACKEKPHHQRDNNQPQPEPEEVDTHQIGADRILRYLEAHQPPVPPQAGQPRDPPDNNEENKDLSEEVDSRQQAARQARPPHPPVRPSRQPPNVDWDRVTVSNKPLVWLRGVASFPAPLIGALIDASTTSAHDEHSSSAGSRQLRERGRVIGYHILPCDELRRAAWCRRIGRKDPGQVELRVCSDRFDGDRDYCRVGSVLCDAGQTMKDVRLKPEAVPSLRSPLNGKPPFSPAEDPASKRQRTLDDDPVEEMDCFVDQTPREQMPREGRCHFRHRASTSDAALQVDPPTARDAAVQVWKEEQGMLLEELRDQPLDLAGDGRCDSPGYSAKYLTYSLHVPLVNKILHCEQVQVGDRDLDSKDYAL